MDFKKLIITALSAALILTGCEYPVNTINDTSILNIFNDETDDQKGVQNTAYVLNNKAGTLLKAKGITLPESKSSIYVSQIGYNSADEKVAIFSGDNLSDTFEVVNKNNNHIAYTGKITGTDVKKGDFSKLTEPGEYYIKSDYVGMSDYFTISENLYANMFSELVNNIYSKTSSPNKISATKSQIIDACFGMNITIYAMQSNGEAFSGDTGLIEQLLNMADDLCAMQKDDGSILDDFEATAAFCGIINMCCNEFGKYGEEMEKRYEEASNKAWEWLSKQSLDTSDMENAKFYAAAQLFSRTNKSEYKTIAEQYIKDRGEKYYEAGFVFFGALSYMNAKGTTDSALCTGVMMDMITKTEEICDNAADDKLYNVGASDIDEIMENTLQICFFNYLVPSSEYNEMLESIIEYIGGYNENGTNYTDSGAASSKPFEYKAIMLFAVSEII